MTDKRLEKAIEEVEIFLERELTPSEKNIVLISVVSASQSIINAIKHGEEI